MKVTIDDFNKFLEKEYLNLVNQARIKFIKDLRYDNYEYNVVMSVIESVYDKIERDGYLEINTSLIGYIGKAINTNCRSFTSPVIYKLKKKIKIEKQFNYDYN